MRSIGSLTSLVLSLALGGAPLQARSVPAASPEGKAVDADAMTPKPTALISYGKGPQQKGELRLPDGKGPFPVAVLIHGGCFVSEMGGTGMQSFAEMLRKRGIATWDVDYRRYGHQGGGWPGSFEDVAAGVDHLAVLAKTYPLDMSRLTVAGHSAGALFASWAATRPKLAAPWTPAADAPRFNSMVVIDGPSTLAPMVGVDAQVCGKPVVAPFMGGMPADKPAEYKIVSAADHLPLGLPQLLVFAELGPFMKPYAAAAKASGDRVIELSPPGADHFDIVTGGAKNGEAVADWIKANAFSVPVQ